VARLKRLLTAAAIVLAAVALLAIGASAGIRLAGGHAYREARAEFEHDWGSLDLEVFQRPDVADEINRAECLRAGAAAIEMSVQERSTVLGLRSPVSTWRDEEVATVRAVLARNRAALATLDRARMLDEWSWGIDYLEGWEAGVRGLPLVLDAVRVVAAGARLAVHDGDLDLALDRSGVVAAAATVQVHEALLVVHIMGLATESLHLGALADAVAHPALERHQLERIGAQIASSDLDTLLHRALRFEIAGSIHASRARGDELTPLETVERMGVRSMVLAAEMDRMDRWLDRYGPPFGRDPARYANEPFPGWWHPAERMSAALEPNLAAIAARSQLVAARRHLVRAAVAVRRIGMTTGTYPADRPPLGPLTEPDRFTGQLLGYRKTADGRATVALTGVHELAETTARGRGLDGLGPITLPAPG